MTKRIWVGFAAGLVSAAALAEVPFVTGGIGAAERGQIEAQKEAYNLQVKAAYTTGHYITDVQISISNDNGLELLNAVTEGPYFYAKLPAGSYTVTAGFEGMVQSQTISIAADTKLREAIFRFKPTGNPEE